MSSIIYLSDETRQLLCAVDLAAWGDPICSHPNVDILAKGAFVRGMITHHQYHTVLLVGKLYKKYRRIQVLRLWSHRNHSLYRVWCRSVGVDRAKGHRMLEELLPCEQVLFVCRSREGTARIFPSAGLLELVKMEDGGI